MTARSRVRRAGPRQSSSGASGADGVRLMWPGRRWRMAAGNPEPGPTPVASRGHVAPRLFDVTPAQPSRGIDGAPAVAPEKEPTLFSPRTPPSARIIHGDVLDLTEALTDEGLAGAVDLVYVDPPYASDRDYVAESRLDGSADGRVVRTHAYEDTWSSKTGGLGAYLDMLAPRLDALVDLLGPKGTIWVHLDWRAAYLVRALLDEVLGREQFLNEIVWRRAPNLGRQATSGQFGRTLDTIVVYGRPGATITPPTRLEPIEESAIRTDAEGRFFTSAPRGDYTDASIAKLDLEGRIHRTASGRVYIKYFLVQDTAGVWCRERRIDALWTDVPPLRHAAASERTGYPTQKPRALLERIIQSATPKGGLVVDAFGGSGTTAVAAHATGRRSVIADRSPVAIATARARLLREGAGVKIERTANALTTAAALDVEVTVAAAGRDDVTVTLATSAEPMAWAVGTMEGGEDGVFRAAWHAERVLGAKAAPAERVAVVPRATASAVRVWADDGSVQTTNIEARRAARSQA